MSDEVQTLLEQLTSANEEAKRQQALVSLRNAAIVLDEVQPLVADIAPALQEMALVHGADTDQNGLVLDGR